MTKNTICTSKKAFDFAKKFLQEKKQEFKNEKATPPKIEQVKKEGPSRQITEIDYKKWEDFVEKLKCEEKEEKEKTPNEEDEYAKAIMRGCAHDHSKERQIFEKSTEEKIKAADRFRLEGNEAFNNKNYGLAAVNYRKALLQFDYTFPDTEEEEKRMNSVKLSCHLNLAACKIFQKYFDEVLIQTRLALEIDSSNCKAYYRQGLAYLNLDEFDLCKKSLTKALHIEPNNHYVKQALLDLHTKIMKYEKHSRKVYQPIFSSMKGEKRTEEKEIDENDKQLQIEKKSKPEIERKEEKEIDENKKQLQIEKKSKPEIERKEEKEIDENDKQLQIEKKSKTEIERKEEKVEAIKEENNKNSIKIINSAYEKDKTAEEMNLVTLSFSNSYASSILSTKSKEEEMSKGAEEKEKTELMNAKKEIEICRNESSKELKDFEQRDMHTLESNFLEKEKGKSKKRKEEAKEDENERRKREKNLLHEAKSKMINVYMRKEANLRKEIREKIMHSVCSEYKRNRNGSIEKDKFEMLFDIFFKSYNSDYSSKKELEYYLELKLFEEKEKRKEEEKSEDEITEEFFERFLDETFVEALIRTKFQIENSFLIDKICKEFIIFYEKLQGKEDYAHSFQESNGKSTQEKNQNENCFLAQIQKIDFEKIDELIKYNYSNMLLQKQINNNKSFFFHKIRQLCIQHTKTLKDLSRFYFIVCSVFSFIFSISAFFAGITWKNELFFLRNMFSLSDIFYANNTRHEFSQRQELNLLYPEENKYSRIQDKKDFNIINSNLFKFFFLFLAYIPYIVFFLFLILFLFGFFFILSSFSKEQVTYSPSQETSNEEEVFLKKKKKCF